MSEASVEKEQTLEELEIELGKLRAAEEAAAKEQRKLEIRLVLRFTKELGPQGAEWLMLRTPGGPVVIARGDSVFYRKLAEMPKDEKTGIASEAALHEVIGPTIKYPPMPEFATLADKYGALRSSCVLMLRRLHESAEEVRAGK